ncbi:MAG: 3-keto-5-aminohexanoate cleavage protein, partial [Salinibacterium sp.]
GNIAGLQPTPAEFGLAIDRVSEEITWSGAGIGDYQSTAQQLAIASGGGVRVGLEDGIYLDRARMTLASNSSLVERVHRMLDLSERRAMTPAEYRTTVLGRA